MLQHYQRLLRDRGRGRPGDDANDLRGRIIGALGGMAAEEEIFDVVTTGAESDLENVTRIARSMVGAGVCPSASALSPSCRRKATRA